MSLTLPVARPVVFPLHPIVDGACGCGSAGCTRIGKHPAVLWRDLAFGDPVPRPAPGAGVALRTGAHPLGSDVIVVDLDGEDAVRKWEELGGGPETLTVETGRAGVGLQLYYAHPGFRVSVAPGALWHNGLPKPLSQAIDIKGDGGFVVAPGSPHKSGKTYRVLSDALVAPAPPWLILWLKERQKTTDIQTYDGDVSGPERERRIARFRDWLAIEPPAIEGQGGDLRLFRVVQRGAYDLALPVDDVLDAIRDVYNPRCVPPWSADELEERVRHKADDAKTISTRPSMPPLPKDLEHLATTDTRLNLDSIVNEVISENIEKNSKNPEPQEIQVITGNIENNSKNPVRALPANIENNSKNPEPKEIPAEEDPTEEDPAEKELGVRWGGWDEEIPPPAFLVEPLIPVATVGIFVAKGSSLKTWTALSIGADVANGAPWLGFYRTRRAPVLIVDFESGRWQLQQRMRLLGKTNCPDLGHANFPSQRIDSADFWKNLARIALRRKLGLVIIDSFAAGASGVDENDAIAAMPLHFASEFSEKLRCAVLFIHHAKKGDGGDERDVARGSGAIYAGCDWMYKFDPASEDRTKMTVHCNKPWGECPKDFRIALTADGLVLDKEADADAAKRSEETERRIRDLLSRGPVADKKLLHKQLKKQNGTCSAEIDAMVAKREIVFLPGKGYTLDFPEARLSRIRAACEVPGTSTPGKVADAAHVDVDEVNDLLRQGTLVRQAGGYMLIGPGDPL